ncbi:MAG: hypothetical protein ACW98Y_01960 [Candidatus Thorarchaeota archaeon]|jgi:hypothetical protein
MSRIRNIISITILLILSAVILIWLVLSYFISPLTVSALIVACVVELALEYTYQHRIEDQKEWNTIKGRIVNVSGMLLYLACNPFLLLLGVPTGHLAVGVFVMILSVPVFGLLGRLLSDVTKAEEDTHP